MPCSLQVIALMLQRGYNGQQFLIVGVVVAFSSCYLAGIECYRVLIELSIQRRMLLANNA
jgi:hypothetical protein